MNASIERISPSPPRGRLASTSRSSRNARGGLLNLNNWRRRVWGPAIEASGVATPARIYDLRATFVSDALAAGVPVFEVAKIAGTSVRMIERHYGRLLDGSASTIAGRLDALDVERDRAAERLGV